MKMSIEPHGDGYAIYLGRGSDHHGFNAAYVNDVDEKLIDDVIRRINSFDGMLEALIKDSIDQYNRDMDNPMFQGKPPIKHREIIENATGKPWEEIKENNE